MIVNGERKKGNETAGIKFPIVKQIVNIPYRVIINDINLVIKMKRGEKSIGINNDP